MRKPQRIKKRSTLPQNAETKQNKGLFRGKGLKKGMNA
jgi:hypothetical protein